MLITIIIFIIILGLLVFVHEFGHFITAKKSGVKAEEFGFGFPPRICGWKKINGKRKFFWGGGEVESEDTVYSLNWIPMGGFVKIKGEDGGHKDEVDSFAGKKLWKRGVILSSGVIMNFVLAIVLLSIGFMLGLPQAIDGETGNAKIKDPQIQVVSIINNSPAEKAKLQMGDVIVKIDNQEFLELESLQNYVGSKTGQPVNLQLKRFNEYLTQEITPEVLEETGKGGMGVGLVKAGIVSYPWYASIWKGAETTVLLTKEILWAFGGLIKNLVVAQKMSVDLSGPVGIAVITGKMVKMGFIYLLQFTALLSINLAIINFLPFPALDGGRVLFLIIEKIRRRPVNVRIENTIHNIGFVLLMFLVVVVTYRDVLKFGDLFAGLWNRIVGLF